MARRLIPILSLITVFVLAALLAGCGVKAPPTPRNQVAPVPASDLKARPVKNGMLVSFGVPGAPSPGRAVEEVRLYYGYLPLTGDPECPPCPPRLRKYHEFNLTVKDSKVNPMEGGRFDYLDTAAPMNMEAVYQLVFIDASGRKSLPSALTRMPRLEPAAAPQGLKAKAGDSIIELGWDKVDTLISGKPAKDLAGYIVHRKGPDGTKLLNAGPVKEPSFRDATVMNGMQYSYRVNAVRQFRDIYLPGESSMWVSATPTDLKEPGAPSDLAAASTTDAIYLRFTPSQDVDTAGYLIWRKTKGGAWKQLNDKPVVENVFIDKDVKPEVTYFYKVQAVDEAGNKSGFSPVLDIVHLP